MIADSSLLRSSYSALVERFGKGWEAGDAKAMAAVFTESGVFIPDPFDPPVTGRQAIAGYWNDVPYEQSEIRFRFGEVYVAGPWFATEFKCTFRRRRTGEPLDVRGTLFCETEGDLISEMRMYYLRARSR
jgi:ketosteroid isomerase-like protein